MEVTFPISLRAREGTRTPDQLITNQLLYQLSYSGLLSCGIMVLTYLPITLQSIKDLSLFGEAKVMEFFKSKNFVEKKMEIFQQSI